ncbi:hypothetical protein EVAR_103947_1 [Eumeta japonica]|uniref:Uncharacterized protein n=1 Tax=Eumeta variegata TaxID=151549 RepID=A0A4C1YC58_EUMVA|nr:hypothetical protein EVAR_103947_1 [Eumeta japonica]
MKTSVKGELLQWGRYPNLTDIRNPIFAMIFRKLWQFSSVPDGNDDCCDFLIGSLVLRTPASNSRRTAARAPLAGETVARHSARGLTRALVRLFSIQMRPALAPLLARPLRGSATNFNFHHSSDTEHFEAFLFMI